MKMPMRAGPLLITAPTQHPEGHPCWDELQKVYPSQGYQPCVNIKMTLTRLTIWWACLSFLPKKVVWALWNLSHMSEKVPWPQHRGTVSRQSPQCQALILWPLTALSTPIKGQLFQGKYTDPTCLHILTLHWLFTESSIQVVLNFQSFRR